LPQFAIRAERQYGFDSEDRLLFVMRMQPGAGLSAASAISAAQKRAEEARLAGDEARRALTDQVQSAFVQWQAARNRLDSARESMTLNQSLFESYTRQYVAGRKTWIDVLNAVREVSQTQYAWADARSQVLAAGLNLWILSGDLPLLQTARSALP
jgi:adhesin transport system outer membrane protein